MKYSCLAFALLFWCPASHAQPRDKRAVLDIQGNVKELSVSPDGSLWIVTATGNRYYSRGMDSLWHYDQPRKHGYAYTSHNSCLDRVSFFNPDTAIISGYIYADNQSSQTSGYYRTTDGGKTWKLLDFGGTSWIYDACTNARGHAWMGGSGKALYHSHDFGRTWTTLKIPLRTSDRIYSIFMTGNAAGIAGSDMNELVSTTDNWKTVAYIPTPLDQQRYKKQEQGYSDDRINKVRSWGNYLAVQQHGRSFYTRKDQIDWQPFPYRVRDFEACPDNPDELWVVGDSMRVSRISAPAGQPVAYPHPGIRSCADVRSLGSSLYILSGGNEVARVDKQGAKRLLPYTTDHAIDPPDNIAQGQTVAWGISGTQLYLADGQSQSWYREGILPLYANDIRLLSDSMALLWDGHGTNYAYTLRDHAVAPYQPSYPLQDFLRSPLRAFVIDGGTRGCFHYAATTVSYQTRPDGTMACSGMARDKHALSGNSDPEEAFSHSIPQADVTTLLSRIDQAPGTAPSIRDFAITDLDKQHYRALLKENQENSSDYDPTGLTGIAPSLPDSAPGRADTLSDATLTAILKESEGYMSTTRNWFEVAFINEQNDTLRVSSNYYVNRHAWNLPWEFEWQGQHFYCYDPAFSRFVRSCIPDDFFESEYFDNRYLLLDIAAYFSRHKP